MSMIDLDVTEGWVRMYHPDLGDDQGRIPTSVVTKESFEDNHSERGWVTTDDTTEIKNIDGTVYVTKVAAPVDQPAEDQPTETRTGGRNRGGDA